tara:strand:- start:1994 stop:3205 length:1212 start_codon:yes stop_codon:yes gene_type:complete
MKRLKANIFPFIIALSALSVSASAAFYSVSGLSKLFAGATFEVIVMAGSLEVAKLVIASLLYQYWNTINKLLRTYLTIAAIILVLITSMGIYGFLSAAYQETYQKLIVNENQIDFLENKAKFYEDDVTRYDKELERISNNISTLSGAKATSIQVRDTSAVGGVRSTVSTAELRLAQSRINVEEENRNAVNEKRTVAADSLQSIKLDILALQNNADTVGELGPLQYLSGLTGTPMDKIINILLLVIIFVFDPLAISLVVAANFAFDLANRKNLYNEYEDEIEPDLWNNLEVDSEEVKVGPLDNYNEDDERRMNIIGQNGNEGEHYEEARDSVQKKVKDLSKKEVEQATKEAVEDWKVVDEKDQEIKEKKKVKRVLQKGPSKNRVQFNDGSTGYVNKDDNTIRYL